MRKKLHIFTILSLSIFAFSAAKSQNILKEGYIITQQNDTIHGLLDISNPDKEIKILNPKFKNDFNLEDDNVFVKEVLKKGNVKDTILLERIVKGSISLYVLTEKHNNIYFMKKDNRLHKVLDESELQGNDSKNKRISEKKYQSLLSYLFEDYPELSNEIKEFKLNKKNLIFFTKKYNNYNLD